MSGASGPGYINFQSLIKLYSKVQQSLVSMVQALANSSASGTNPGKFLLVQFKMAQVTQMGESISNLISTVNSLINSTVRNQRAQ